MVRLRDMDPNDPRVGYDAVIQAEAGFMFMNGEPGGASLKMPVALDGYSGRPSFKGRDFAGDASTR